MDPSKPPTRLKVVLLSLPPRTQAVLDYFFASTGRSSFEPTSSDAADAAIFDVDTLESRQHWEAFHGRSGRPGIAMSIQPQQVPGAVWVRKPITPAALLSAAAELHAGRWMPDPVAAAPVAEPIASITPITPIAATAPAIEPVAPLAPLANQAPEVMPTPVAPAPAPQPAAAPVAAVQAAGLPAAEPIAVAPPVQPVAGMASVAASAPTPLPAATASLGTRAETHADTAAVTSSRVAVRPVAAAAVARPAAPAAMPARSASAPAVPRTVPSAPRAAPSTARDDARNTAARSGLGGFFKRLFGLDPVAPPAATLAAARPAPLAASRSAPLQPTPVSRIATPSATAAVHESDADLDEDEDDDGNWHEESAADAAGPARSPFTPGAPKAGLGTSKAARRRGRKVTTRWVDLGAAAPAHADAHADTVVVEAVVVGGPDPVAAPAVDRPADAPATFAEVDTVAETRATASTDTVDALPTDSLAPTSPVTPAVTPPVTPAEVPRVATSWRVATTPQDLADEALYCGQADDVSYEALSHDVSRRYEPALSLVGALTEAYLVAGKWRVPTQLDCSAGRIVVDTTRNRVHLGFDAQHLPSLWTTPIERRRKTQALNRQEQGALDALPPEAWQPLDRLLWRAGLLGAAGRLPEGTDLRAPVYLKHWPNLTRVQRTPHALRIAALWAIRGGGLMETAELLHIPQRHVFAFYNAALAMDLITIDGSQVKRSQRRAGRNRGMLTRLLGWLQH